MLLLNLQNKLWMYNHRNRNLYTHQKALCFVLLSSVLCLGEYTNTSCTIFLKSTNPSTSLREYFFTKRKSPGITRAFYNGGAGDRTRVRAYSARANYMLSLVISISRHLAPTSRIQVRLALPEVSRAARKALDDR